MGFGMKIIWKGGKEINEVKKHEFGILILRWILKIPGEFKREVFLHCAL